MYKIKFLKIIVKEKKGRREKIFNLHFCILSLYKYSMASGEIKKLTEKKCTLYF